MLRKPRHRFASPLGVLGAPFRNPLDVSRLPVTGPPSLAAVAWALWRVPGDALFGTDAPGQAWTMQFDALLASNVLWLPANDLPKGRWDTQQPAQVLPPSRACAPSQITIAAAWTGCWKVATCWEMGPCFPVVQFVWSNQNP